MTKQELIDHLQHLEKYTHYSEDAPALREVIEMLKCSGNPNGSDTIYRQAAIDALHMHLMYRMGTDSNKKRLDDWINGLPSAQPERKNGRWIERNPQNSPDCRLIECSECGNAYIVGYNIDYDDWIDGRNFCMKCGANLRGGSNGKST